MQKILKRKIGSLWWTDVGDFKSDYLEECRRGRFTQNNTEYFESKLKEEGSIDLLWADYINKKSTFLWCRAFD